MKIKEIGHIEKGTGKHQSNVVYSVGGGIARSDGSSRSENLAIDTRYEACDETSYCIDANYWKGTTVSDFLRKHRRQLIIEKWRNDETCM